MYIVDADGSSHKHVKTGQAFDFLQQWPPDSAWMLFLPDEHDDCHLLGRNYCRDPVGSADFATIEGLLLLNTASISAEKGQ